MRILIHDYAGHAFAVGLSRELARRGHEVIHAFAGGLLTPRGSLARAEDDPPGLQFREVEMSPNYRRDKYRFVKRRKYEIAYGRELRELICRERPDVILSGQTPSEPQWMAARCARALGIPFISWIQDFYSLAVGRLASKKSAVLGKLAGLYYREVDRRYLRISAHTVSICDDFIPMLRDYGVGEDRISVIENWGAVSDIPLRPKRNEWSAQHGLADKRVLMYSGTLAMKHNPEPLAKLASDHRGEEDLAVVVVSEGPGAEYLEKRAKEMNLANLKTLPFQPFEAMPDVFGSADVFLALLEPDAGIFSVPSKILSYLCAGRPTLAAMPRENLAARLLERSGAGWVVGPGDDESFSKAASSLLGDPNRRQAMGEAGRRYAEANFEIGTVCDRFEAAFHKAMGTAWKEPQTIATR